MTPVAGSVAVRTWVPAVRWMIGSGVAGSIRKVSDCHREKCAEIDGCEQRRPAYPALKQTATSARPTARQNNMATHATILALLTGAALTISAAETKKTPLDLSKLPPAASGPVDFAKDIQPLFAAKCYSCHGAEKQKGGLRLDIKVAALEGGDNGKVFVPGKSAESKLVHALAGIGEIGIMPPKEKPLTPAEIGKVRAWIDAGANWPDVMRHWAAGRRSRCSSPEPS